MEPLAKLFGSQARLKILRLFMFNQGSNFTLSEVATRTRLGTEVAREELSGLVSATVLIRKGARATAQYQVNQRFEHLIALGTFIRETTNVQPQNIIATLRRAGILRFVALSGLFTNTSEPQVDLLVVGDNLEDRALTQAVHLLEVELGREIRYASFTTPDFRYRLGFHDRLLRDVFDYPHKILINKIGA